MLGGWADARETPSLWRIEVVKLVSLISILEYMTIRYAQKVWSVLLYHKNGLNGARDNQPYWVIEPYSASGIRDHCASQSPFLQSGFGDYSSSYP